MRDSIIRALRLFFREHRPFYYEFPFEEKPRISVKEDFPAWAAKDGATRTVRVEAEVQVFKTSDEGLYHFLVDYLNIKEQPDVLSLVISTASGEAGEPSVSAVINGVGVDSRKAQEVLNKIQSSPTTVFHDSTDSGDSGFLTRESSGRSASWAKPSETN